MTQTPTTPPTTPPTEQQGCTSERAAHQMLALVGEHPGRIGRLRCARIVGGYPVPNRDDAESQQLATYAVSDLEWPLREITRLVDALITGGLMSQTEGPRPTLVLTRAGHRALDALDGDRSRSC